MANVLNRITKQYLKSVNTPDYHKSEWIINPVLPVCNPKYYIIEGDTVREMDAAEKNELSYSTESSIYLITEKQLLININGHDYETNTNAIINPTMPVCDIKYTKAVDDSIIEMSDEEKHVVDLPSLKKEWIDNIVAEVYKTHSVEEVSFLALLIAVGKVSQTGTQATEIKNTVLDALNKYPKPT